MYSNYGRFRLMWEPRNSYQMQGFFVSQIILWLSPTRRSRITRDISVWIGASRYHRAIGVQYFIPSFPKPGPPVPRVRITWKVRQAILCNESSVFDDQILDGGVTIAARCGGDGKSSTILAACMVIAFQSCTELLQCKVGSP